MKPKITNRVDFKAAPHDKKLLYWAIENRQFYITESFYSDDIEAAAVKSGAGRYLVKTARGRIVSKFDVLERG